jgi:hypothetical protein
VKLDGAIAGHVLFFHHMMGHLTHRFKVPPEAQEVRSLVAVFLPWALSPAKLAHQWRKPPNEYLPAKIEFQPMVPDLSRWGQLMQSKPFYQHALHILKFPVKLHDFMSQEKHRRTYGICPEKHSKKGRRGVETSMLIAIMEQCRAKQKNPADSRVVFIHISMLKTLLKLPAVLAHRKDNLVHYYMYGTHYSIKPEHWGFREIFQSGMFSLV